MNSVRNPPLYSPAGLTRLISTYWLPLGYLVLLTGLFWLPERSQYARLFYLLIAAPALIGLMLRPPLALRLLREPLLAGFIVFSGWLLLTLVWSPVEDPGAMVKRPLYVFMLFGACTLMAMHGRERTLPNVLHAGAIVLALLSAYALIEHQLVAPQRRLVGTGSLVNPLLTSHILGVFCSYWLGRWVCLRGLQPLAVVAGGVLLVGMLATGSRTPLIGLSIAVLTLALVWHRRKAFLLLGALLLGALLVLLLMPDVLTQRGLSHRPEIWGKAIDLIASAPWIGHGYGADLSIPVPDLKMSFSDPHNVWLAVGFESGLIGLALWAAMYLAAALACVRNRENPDFAIAFAMLGYGLAAGMTEGSNFLSRPNESWFLTWIPLALIAALSIRQRSLENLGPALDGTALDQLLGNAQVIEADGYGTKVAILANGDFIKLYRRKRLISSALLTLPALRFANNARRLKAMGIVSPTVTATFQIPQRRLNAVQYQPLPGESLRQRWQQLDDQARAQEVFEFGRFLGELHERGVFFRSLHLGNVLRLPEGGFGLIDLSDMTIQPSPLSAWRRRRNLRHMRRYELDEQWLMQRHASQLQQGYAARCGERAAALLAAEAAEAPEAS